MTASLKTSLCGESLSELTKKESEKQHDIPSCFLLVSNSTVGGWRSHKALKSQCWLGSEQEVEPPLFSSN